ncbi:MAG: hypothetical protein D3909_17320, partial [Candidatus Electrothrix sp. ATG1]|nr:hypothetical protein [Candidatus Electrothrix sp. ATG1]
LDQDGCSGPYSDPLSFFIDSDELPPYLALHSPDKDIVSAEKEIEVRGEVEKDASLRLNGQELKPDADGRFSRILALSQGSTLIRVEAEDQAGNTSVIERRVTLQQDSPLIRLDSSKEVISKTKDVAISGWLQPGAQLRVNNLSVQASGTFNYLLHLAEGKHTVDVEAVSPDGQRNAMLRLQIVVDLHPPEIQVNDFEQATAEQQIILSGVVSEQGKVTLNGRSVKLSDRSFTETVVLTEGSNELLLVAKDSAGNQGTWKKNILFDSQPPEILQKEVSIPEAKGGEVVRLTARIRDAGAGTARSGSFILAVNGTRFRGILKRTEGDDAVFSGDVFVLPGVAGAVKVQEIRVKDILGNVAEYLAEDTGE